MCCVVFYSNSTRDFNFPGDSEAEPENDFAPIATFFSSANRGARGFRHSVEITGWSEDAWGEHCYKCGIQTRTGRWLKMLCHMDACKTH